MKCILSNCLTSTELRPLRVHLGHPQLARMVDLLLVTKL